MSVADSLIERFRERLPVDASTPIISMGEGATPLIKANRYSERLDAEVWLKFEGVNPTGSFKDRGMTLAVSKAVQEGARAIICASTGNTAASAAAYAARAGVTAVILQPEGAVALGKMAQALAAGARVIEVRGSFGEAISAAVNLSQAGEFALVNSINPYRLEGQKTAAIEIVEELGFSPDLLVLPYGSGGNTIAYAQGFAEADAGVPRLLAAEASNRSETVASAIRITTPVHAAQAKEAIDLSEGAIIRVSDEAILQEWQDLARVEGVFCEPASAAGLAALEQCEIAPGSRVVCVITGHGLKDPETATRLSDPPVSVSADPDEIAKAIT